MWVSNLIRDHATISRLASSIYSFLGHNRVSLKGKNNVIAKRNTFVKRLKCSITGNNNHIIIKESRYAIRNLTILIHGNNNILYIDDDFATDGLTFVFEDDNNAIRIGKNCHGGGASEISAIEGTSVEIGDDCMLSANIKIRTGDSHSILEANTGKRINPSKSITMGNHVWIGNSVIILKGTKIENDCIVAAGSVVPGKSYKAHSIIGGNPAAVIKEGITWLSERL